MEIETDKAQMDVEAQDDGIMFKITQKDGAKGVKVGARIAVLADPGDDVSSLEVPAEQSSTQAQAATKEKSPQEETKSGIDPEKSSESQAEAPPTSKSGSDTSVSAEPQKGGSSGRTQNKKYPLYPSVEVLLHQKGISLEDANKIPATGPNGRLLKGDILAYLGQIAKDYPAAQSKRIEKLGHLDLSNITLATPKKADSAPKAPEKTLPPPPKDTEIAVPISLSAVIATQKRVQDTLGIRLPLSIFIARASELANEDLPLATKKATSDDLFHSVLGLDSIVPRSSRGAYFPSVTSLADVRSAPAATKARKADVFDELIGGSARAKSVRPSLPPVVGVEGVAATTTNVFSVLARSGEEKRVEAYLEKMKVVLEAQPGRLVL